jgi:farnesyl diphosphate synthase
MSSEQPITQKQIATAEAKIHARKRFEGIFPLLVDELTSSLRSINLPENAIEWFKNVSLVTSGHH